MKHLIVVFMTVCLVMADDSIEANEFFEMYDSNNDGKVSRQQITQKMREIDSEAGVEQLQDPDYYYDLSEALFTHYDSDHDEAINEVEFAFFQNDIQEQGYSQEENRDDGGEEEINSLFRNMGLEEL